MAFDVDPRPLLAPFGLDGPPAGGDFVLQKHTPVNARIVGRVSLGGTAALEAAAATATVMFARLRRVPMPVRGQIAREIGEAFRARQAELAALVTLEVGKIGTEAWGEIQEIIDVCDFACGLSRTIGGAVLPSERPDHRLVERWHPLGPVLCITAFNFPAAVWGWNAAIALVCGDPLVWKPSLKAPFTALACQKVVDDVLRKHELQGALQTLLVDDAVAAAAAADPRFPLVSATGSTRMGRAVQQSVASRFGRCLLELGGNNAVVVMDDADLDLALRAVVFGAFGTAGQRCTSTRRLLVHRTIVSSFAQRVVDVARRLPIGDPFDGRTLLGPLIDEDAGVAYARALDEAARGGATVLCGGRVTDGVPSGTVYVHPAVLVTPRDLPLLRHEVFAPLLHVIPIDDVDDAIAVNNAVPQGLSAAIFTRDLRKAERFVDGSDCGLCNVNTGTSGAEIGGAFGGEKETGGGRESGSDSWKQYMRRQTSAVNYGDALPLAQGVRFDCD